jgi:hypothetical protein
MVPKKVENFENKKQDKIRSKSNDANSKDNQQIANDKVKITVSGIEKKKKKCC